MQLYGFFGCFVYRYFCRQHWILVKEEVVTADVWVQRPLFPSPRATTHPPPGNQSLSPLTRDGSCVWISFPEEAGGHRRGGKGCVRSRSSRRSAQSSLQYFKLEINFVFFSFLFSGGGAGKCIWWREVWSICSCAIVRRRVTPVRALSDFFFSFLLKSC